MSRAFRLSRKGDVYDVAQTVHGPICDCPDFIFRRDGLDPRGCLHIRAMRAVGMLEPTLREPVATRMGLSSLAIEGRAAIISGSRRYCESRRLAREVGPARRAPRS